jgi:hypothetical protein
MAFFFPLAAILISVKDVDAAFRRIKVRSRDVSLNATRIGGVIAIYGYLSFGFAGSPGIFSEVSSGPLTAYHKGHAPEEPRWHGPLAFFSAAFVNDSALITYKFGLLKYLSECCFLTGLCALFGYHGLNVAKDAKVGPWKEIQHVWGLTFDTRRRTIGMSPVRLVRAARTLEDTVWARGNSRVQLLEVQHLAGSTRWYCQANRAMRGAQNDIIRMLSTDDPARKWVSPRGPKSYKRWCWANLWDACELLRVGLNDLEQWHAPYISTFLGALSPEFRLAFPSANTPEERFLQGTRFRGSRARYVGPGAGPGEVLGLALRRQVRAASLRAGPELSRAGLEATLAQFPNLTSVVVELPADVSIVDADSPYNRVVLALGAQGFEVSTSSLLATELGDTFAHARLVVLGESRALVAALGEPDGVSSQTTTQRAVRGIMAPPVPGVRSSAFVPSLGADRGASRPRRVGYRLGDWHAHSGVFGR